MFSPIAISNDAIVSNAFISAKLNDIPKMDVTLAM